jgi:hypothetical protein
LNRVVNHVIQLPPPLPADVAQRVAAFWGARGVRFSEVTDVRMFGRRGSLWWNAVTFDMGKLKTEVTVTFDAAAGTVACTLRINTLLQTITDMNRQYWTEEMGAFESFLLHGDDRAAEWQQFKRGYNKASVGWIFAIAVAVSIAMSARELVGPLLSWLAGVFGA